MTNNGWSAKRIDDVVSVELEYPRIEGHANAVEVGLMDVRAADSVRLVYDFERDGWSVQQESITKGEFGEPVEGEWREVYFAQAWALEK